MNKIDIYKKFCKVTLENTKTRCDELYNRLLENGNFKSYYPDMMKALVDAAVNIGYKDSWIYGVNKLTKEEVPLMQQIYDEASETLLQMKSDEMQRSIEYKCKRMGGLL